MNANATFQTIQSAPERVLALKHEVETALEEFLPTFDRFALLDFPDHSNVGDSAIWLGETTYFREKHNKHPSLVTAITRDSMDDMIRDLPDGAIFLHGGGNFGDIYPSHHAWREELLRRTKGRPVIQMPQSIHYQDSGRIKQTAKIIAEHGNFSILVRDFKSLKIAQDNFQCRVGLCPDMAFMLGPIARPSKPSIDIFCLMRTDDEQAGHDASTLARSFSVSSEAADWLTDDTDKIRRLRQPGYLDRIKAARWGGLSRSNYRNLSFHLMASQRLNRGLAMLSSGKWVMTDRLHAHILSLLLGIPHVALDNNYGKISSFMQAWTTNVPSVYAMTDSREALQFISSQIKR